jgi:hypothetical protein
MYLIGFPLLVIPLAIYNIIAFLMPGLNWTDKIATVHLMSGQDWTVTTEDVLIGFTFLLLAIEIIKSTRLGRRSIVDHILSLLLFIAMLVEFLLVQQAGSSTFFLLMVASFVDVVTGFTVTARTAQRDLVVQNAERV